MDVNSGDRANPMAQKRRRILCSALAVILTVSMAFLTRSVNPQGMFLAKKHLHSSSRLDSVIDQKVVSEIASK